MKRIPSIEGATKLHANKDVRLPDLNENLESILRNGNSLRIEGTNVIRVPFGVRRPTKKRPEKQGNWVTLVLPFNPVGSPTPPPQAA